MENIEERDTTAISNIPDMVGSGQSVGGVVSETVILYFNYFDYVFVITFNSFE